MIPTKTFETKQLDYGQLNVGLSYCKVKKEVSVKCPVWSQCRQTGFSLMHKFQFSMITFQSGAWYSSRVRRNDTELLILRSNGDVMTVSQSLRNVDEAH